MCGSGRPRRGACAAGDANSFSQPLGTSCGPRPDCSRCTWCRRVAPALRIASWRFARARRAASASWVQVDANRVIGHVMGLLGLAFGAAVVACLVVYLVHAARSRAPVLAARDSLDRCSLGKTKTLIARPNSSSHTSTAGRTSARIPESRGWLQLRALNARHKFCSPGLPTVNKCWGHERIDAFQT